MSQTDERVCALHLANGRREECTRDACVFWESGGVIVTDDCLVERLGLDVRQTNVAAYLLEMRERVDQTRDLEAAEASLFAAPRRRRVKEG